MADLKRTTIDGGLHAWENDAQDANLILTTTDQGELVNADTGLQADPTALAVGRTSAREKVHVEGAVEAWDFRIGEEYVGDRLDLLENLLPSAPTLSNFSSSSGTDGRLSFDDTNTIAGVEPAPGFNRNDLYDISGDRRGILGSGDNTSGTLNPQVSSTDEHNADIFGRATEGVLKLVVNGSEIGSVEADLDSTNSPINTVDGNGTGFNLSAADPLTFPDGSNFTGVYQRSGSWNVGSADLRSGYNTVKVRHETDAGQLIGETQTVEYVVDDDTADITFGTPALSNLNTSGSKNLSGVEYNTGATADFSVTIDNVYKNTYQEGNAITFPTTNRCAVSSQSIPSLSGGDNETKTINLSAQASVNVTRIISNDIGVQARITDPVDGNSPYTSSLVSDYDLLIDNQGDSDSDLRNRFQGESYRIPSNEDFDTDLSGGWDSTISIADGSIAGYNNGVQVINDRIEYPSINFGAIADGPAGNPDYSTATGVRYYYGYFTDTTATSNWSLEIDGSATLVTEGTVSTGTDEVAISIKLPTLTGWMDINEPFVTGQTADGDGAYQAVNGSNQFIGGGSDIGITSGTQSTANSFDKLYYRITVPENWTGNITDILCNWGA